MSRDRRFFLGESSVLRRSKRLRRNVNISNRFLEGSDNLPNTNVFRRNSRRHAFGFDNVAHSNLPSLPQYEDIGDCENICPIWYAYFWFY